MQERHGQETDPLFPTSRGSALSRDAVALLVAKYAGIARGNCPSLRNKIVSPHTLRHSCAMALSSGVEATVISLWLGHEQTRTVDVYVHADLTIKERALARTTPAHSPTAHPVGTTPRTGSSPFSKACDYAECFEPISACQQVIDVVLGVNASSALRMDLTGARWGLHGAEAILKLRALRCNGDFDTYWRYHLAQEQQRVHQSRYADNTVPKAA